MFELVVDNAKLQLNCHDEAPLSPLEPFTSDHYWTRGRLIRTTPSHSSDTDEFVDFYADRHIDHDIDFYNFFLGPNTTTILYLVDIDGVEQPSPDWIPVHDGYELVRVQPFIIGYVVGDSRTSAALGTGYHPEPVKKPYIAGHVAGSYDLAWGDDPQWVGYPGDMMFCGADDQLTHFIPSGLNEGHGLQDVHMEPVDSNTTHLVVNLVGMRLYWEPV